MEAQSKFASMLGNHHLKRQVERKGLLSRREFVRFGPLLTVGGFLFETGAVLGRAMRDRLVTFAYPFCGTEPDYEPLADFIREAGRNVASRGSDASAVHELAVISEMLELDSTRRADEWATWMMEKGDQEISLEMASERCVLFGIRGVGFGAEFPERFEQLYVDTYTHSDSDRERWKEASEHGLEIPSEPDQFVPLETRTQTDLAMFAEYCAEFYPDYVAKLGLGQFVGQSG